MAENNGISGFSVESRIRDEVFLFLVREPYLVKDGGDNHRIFLKVSPISLYGFKCNVARREGGPWYFLGHGRVAHYGVCLRLKRVSNIVFNNSEFDKFVFEYSTPGFPDNVVELLEQAAVNSMRAL